MEVRKGDFEGKKGGFLPLVLGDDAYSYLRHRSFIFLRLYS